MTGSLKIKNDTFYAVINLKEDGKYKQKWISTKLKVKGNKRKATEFLNKIMAEYEAKKNSTKHRRHIVYRLFDAMAGKKEK